MSDSDRPSRRVILRDLLIFQIKLWLDGLKDVVLSPVSIGACVLDVLFRRKHQRGLFYRVMRTGERFDLWLNLYGAAKDADERRSGLAWDALELPPSVRNVEDELPPARQIRLSASATTARDGAGPSARE
jgi:hypothetical protein